MKLYNADLSPNAWRVRAVAAELGIDLDIIQVDMRGGGTKTPEFLAMNPNGKVPVLADGDFVLWESRAITAYLASKKPESGLYPDDPKTRAIVDQWNYWQSIHLGPTIQKIVFETFLKNLFGMGEADEAVVAAEKKTLEPLLTVLDQALADKDWLDAWPNVARWLAAMEARDSFKTANAPVAAMLG